MSKTSVASLGTKAFGADVGIGRCWNAGDDVGGGAEEEDGAEVVVCGACRVASSAGMKLVGRG